MYLCGHTCSWRHTELTSCTQSFQTTSASPRDLSKFHLCISACMQGNCGDPFPVAALGLSAEEAGDLLPLKPRQCLVVVDDTMLMVNSGTLWLHNLYLKVVQNHDRVETLLIAAGSNTSDEQESPHIKRSDIYVTSVTFDAQPYHKATAISTGRRFSSVYVGGTLLPQGTKYVSTSSCGCRARVRGSTCTGRLQKADIR